MLDMKDELDRILQEAQFGRVDELAQKLHQIKAKWIKFLRIKFYGTAEKSD